MKMFVEFYRRAAPTLVVEDDRVVHRMNISELECLLIKRALEWDTGVSALYEGWLCLGASCIAYQTFLIHGIHKKALLIKPDLNADPSLRLR